MKNLLLVCSLFLSLMSTAFSQTQLPSPNGEQIACPDPAVVGLDLHWISIYPPQDYQMYNILGEIKNVGAGFYNPGPSMMTAFLYADRGLGYKLVKKEILPPLAPGQSHFIPFQAKLNQGQSVPKYLLKIAPTKNAPPILSDCNKSNNQKIYIHGGGGLIGATSLTSGQ